MFLLYIMAFNLVDLNINFPPIPFRLVYGEYLGRGVRCLRSWGVGL